MSAPTIDRTQCPASRHGTRKDYDRGCRCADARDDARPTWRAESRKRAGIGRRSHGLGRRRSPDIDPVVVERSCSGDLLPITTGEIRQATVRLTGWGLSTRQIAERLHVSMRTVNRHRTAAAAGDAR